MQASEEEENMYLAGYGNGNDFSPSFHLYDSLEATQEMTMHATSPSKNIGVNHEIQPKTDAWGMLRRKGGTQEEHKLEHRTKDGKRDTYVIGRSTKADIVVEDRRVSAAHCAVYCDYTEARLRVFVEDMSANGTFVNDSLIRLTRGQRLELKTGDEVFLINPRNIEERPSENCAAFLYINLRERLFIERTIGSAPSSSSFKHPSCRYVMSDSWFVIFLHPADLSLTHSRTFC